jgi:Fur family peroxide stress response transcriptional regulator
LHLQPIGGERRRGKESAPAPGYLVAKYFQVDIVPRVDSHDADARLASLVALGRARGLPTTPQRRVIFEALCRRDDHPTADDLYEDVRARLPGVSRTTVYRTLDRLVDLGLAMRVHRLGWAARFDAHVDPHDHAVCVRCGTMRDLASAGRLHPAALAGGALREAGYEVVGETTQVHVLCPACRAAPEATAGPSSPRKEPPR